MNNSFTTSYYIADKYKMLSRSEVYFLKQCVKMLSDNPVIVNIGANIGTSAIAMLEARPDAFIFSIDIEPKPEERKNVLECGLDPSRIVRILGDSSEVGENFPYKIDLVFFDGDHTDWGLGNDLRVWLPKIKKIAVFHDYHHPNYEKKPNVNLDKIVDKIMENWNRIGGARYMVAFSRLLSEGEYIVD